MFSKVCFRILLATFFILPWFSGGGIPLVQAQVDIPVGLVLAAGPPSPYSLDWLAADGLMQAEFELGIDGTIYYVSNPEEYTLKLEQCVTDGNQLCLAHSFFFTDAIMAKAQEHPEVDFALINASLPLETFPPNLKAVVTDYEQMGFLAGAIGGLKTSTKKIGVVGGMDIPPIFELIAGYRNGAACVNRRIMVTSSYAGAFDQPELGATLSQELMFAGNDVIFNAAGGTGNGAILYAAQNGAWAVGVDEDQYYTVFEGGVVNGANRLLSSALTRTDRMVYLTVADFVQNLFSSGQIKYGVKEGVVELAPFHDAASAISRTAQRKLFTLTQSLKSGQITASEGCYPSIGLINLDESLDAGQAFSSMSRSGLLRAMSRYSIASSEYITSGSNIWENVNRCATEGNELCISVSFLFADATYQAALNHPETLFNLLDWYGGFDTYPDNLRSVSFAHDELGYLAGVLAAKMTTSQVIGDIGGMEIPPVTDFMNTYRIGAECTSPTVSVLEQYTGTFSDPDLGAQVAEDMMALNADVIFAPAGGTGEGAILFSAQQGAWVIGVDVDQYLTVFGNGVIMGAEKILTSAMKRVDNVVYATVADYMKNAFTPGNWLANLANQGVALAPWHEAVIPAAVKAYMLKLQKAIIAGTVDIHQTCP